MRPRISIRGSDHMSVRLVNNWPLSRRVILHLQNALVYYKNVSGNKQNAESALDFTPAKIGHKLAAVMVKVFKKV